MQEHFDAYTDNVTYLLNHWGATLSLYRTDPSIDESGNRPRHLLGNVRMSNEHLKTLLYVIARTLVTEERRTNANYDATPEIMEELRIDPEDWGHFWDAMAEIIEAP